MSRSTSEPPSGGADGLTGRNGGTGGGGGGGVGGTGVGVGGGGGSGSSGKGGALRFGHGGLGITVDVPAGWSVESSDTFPVQLFAPVRQGYRSNLMFSLEGFSPPTPEGFASFVASVRAAQRRDYAAFCEESAEEVELDGRPALLQRYRWGPEDPAPAMAQLLALVVLEPGHLLEVDGATTAELAAEMRPLLEGVLSSVRFSS